MAALQDDSRLLSEIGHEIQRIALLDPLNFDAALRDHLYSLMTSCQMLGQRAASAASALEGDAHARLDTCRVLIGAPDRLELHCACHPLVELFWIFALIKPFSVSSLAHV